MNKNSKRKKSGVNDDKIGKLTKSKIVSNVTKSSNIFKVILFIIV
jgi:hypothetical protein